MANIQNNLNQLKESVYGEDVRDSIISSIEQMNTECEEAKDGYQQAKNEVTSVTSAANAAAINANTKAGLANTAATNANQIKTTLETKLANGDFKGAKGDTGPAGSKGDTGPKGDKGDPAATIAVDSVVTGAPGTNAVVTNVGTTNAVKLKFTIPQGAAGAQGPAGKSAKAGAYVIPDIAMQDAIDLNDIRNVYIMAGFDQDMLDNYGVLLTLTARIPGELMYDYLPMTILWKPGETSIGTPYTLFVNGTLYLIWLRSEGDFIILEGTSFLTGEPIELPPGTEILPNVFILPTQAI